MASSAIYSAASWTSNYIKTSHQEPKVRAEIQAPPSSISDSELARQYGVSYSTICHWRYPDDDHDR
jgi:hypothetical protein